MTPGGEQVPRGFAMQRPVPSAASDGTVDGTGSAEANGAAAPEPLTPEPLAPDDTVDLAAEEQALLISQLLDKLDAEFVGLAPV